jgi:catechol 2,3-dioxygenase-like lactoylglutathione lyase family enzyme
MLDGTVYDHTGFITPSLDGSVRFWTETMGFEAKPTVERYGAWVESFTGVAGAKIRIAHLFGHGAHLEFIEFVAPAGSAAPAPANQAAVGHVCLRVPDLQALHDRIIAHGGQPLGRITAITEGPASGIRGLYLRDPYGVIIELLELAPVEPLRK